MKGFNFKLPIQLRYSDFDMLGHMNSAQYSTLIELGRIEYYMHIKWNLKNVSNVVASYTIDYLNQVVPTDKVEIWVRVVHLGTKSFKMEYVLSSVGTKTIFAKAVTTQVCILKKDNSSTPIPTEIKSAISNFEGI